MRKLKLQMQITIDGFVSGPNGENDWIFIPGPQDPAALQSTAEIAKSCDTLLIGRKNTRAFVDHWEKTAGQPENPWQPFAQHITDMRKIVFSSTETEMAGPNLEVENGDLETVVNELKSQPGKDILVYGGVGFARSLINFNLVDEYYLIVNPVAIVQGQTVFTDKKLMKLDSSTVYTNGKMLNKYLPV